MMNKLVSTALILSVSVFAFSVQAQDELPDEALFTVNKFFTDGNTGGVDVTLDCFDGLPLTQTQTATQAQNVTFTVHSFEQGDLDCNVTESDSTGYTGIYNEGDGISAVNCSWADATGGDYACRIINTPTDDLVTVTKEWIIDGEGGDEVDSDYDLTLWCDNPIDGGYYYGEDRGFRYWYYDLTDGASGTATADYTAYVTPDWDGGTNCYVDEYTSDSAVDSSDTCGSLLLELDGGDSCTVTNEVFFEGIPSLNQYGLAILALFMLSIGFVGFRRFVL
jgi:hypothetical protein